MLGPWVLVAFRRIAPQGLETGEQSGVASDAPFPDDSQATHMPYARDSHSHVTAELSCISYTKVEQSPGKAKLLERASADN